MNKQVFANLPFRNWANSASSFQAHAKSTKHLNNSLKAETLVAQYENKTNRIDNVLKKTTKAKYEVACNGLLQVAKTIIFCGKLGLPLRGHDDKKILRNLDEV